MSFQEIKGQDAAINLIQAALEEGRLANAYLFIGPKGVGKGLAAKNFAKAINCLQNKFSPCDNCESCRKIESLNHPDVHWLEPRDSGYLKIDDIRQLQQQSNLKAIEARRKVFIIKDADQLTEEAANCFLKTLEEPGQNTVFILTTSKLGMIFSTVISRCQKVYFSLLDRHGVEELLKTEYGFDNKNSHYLAFFYEGRLGEALKFRDCDILVEKNRIIDSLFQRQDLITGPDEGRQSIIDFLQVLLSWFRDIYLSKAGLPVSELIHLDRKTQVYDLCNKYSFFRLEQIMAMLDGYILYLDKNVNIKLILRILKERLWTA